MTPEVRELFRKSLLLALDRTGAPQGLNATGIAMRMAALGFPVAKAEDVQKELAYLLDKGLVAKPEKTISPEVALWRITAPGRDFLAEQGF